MRWWMWVLLGAAIRESIHVAAAMWSAYQAGQPQVVSEAWRTEQIQEAGKSGR